MIGQLEQGGSHGQDTRHDLGSGRQTVGNDRTDSGSLLAAQAQGAKDRLLAQVPQWHHLPDADQLPMEQAAEGIRRRLDGASLVSTLGRRRRAAAHLGHARRGMRRTAGHRVEVASGRWLAGQSAFGGADVGPNPTDRGKNGTKTNLLVEGQGGPLGVSTAPAHWHDSVCLEDLLYSIVVERPEEEEHLLLDKGYDNPTGHQTAAEFGYIAHIRPIRAETRPRRPGRRKARRWVVERTLAWLRKCRAILVRYNKKAENYLGLLQLACALIWYRRLWKLRKNAI